MVKCQNLGGFYTFPTSTMVKWKWTQRLCWCYYRNGTMVFKVAIVEMTIFYSDIVYRHNTSSDIVRVGHLQMVLSFCPW